MSFTVPSPYGRAEDTAKDSSVPAAAPSALAAEDSRRLYQASPPMMGETYMNRLVRACGRSLGVPELTRLALSSNSSRLHRCTTTCS
jgi:hypothetical protein